MLSTLNSLSRITCVLFLIAPTSIALADHVPTQTPYDISIACDSSNGDITVTWQESDGFESSPPERYAIGFDVNENGTADAYAVANSTGWETALSYKSYVFSASYRESIFGNTQGTFNAKVRADNDTDASYSEWTSTVGVACDYGSTTTTSSTTTTTLPPAVPDDATNVSVNYQGKDVYFAWEYTEGNTLAKEFHINYSYDNSIWDRVVITDTTSRIYTLDYTNIQTGTFYWTFSVCGDIENGESCTDSDSNNFETYEYVAPTTTLAPVVEEVYVEPEPLPPPPEEIIVDIVVEGVDKTYTQADVNDGTIERDQERIDNELEFGCFMTNAQIERGDCIIIIEVYEEEDYEEEYNTEEELFNDVVVVDEVEDEFIEEEFIELTEQKIEELEKQMEFEVKELELKEEIEFFEFDNEEEAQEFIETFIEVEEFLEELEEVEIEEIVFEDIPKDIIIEIEDEITEDELVKEVFTDESEAETEVQEQVVEEEVELTEEEIKVEVAELEEVIEEIIVIDIPEVTEEELEEYTEEELIEYEEAKEEAIEEFVEELETEEVVEILEEINDVGVENLAEVSQEVIEVVAQVVEEAITIAQEEELTQEQTEVVAEVLGFKETKDVQIIAEAVKTDENVAQAVDEFVERAVEYAKTNAEQEFTLADATTEIAFESFVASPVSVIIDIDLDAINLNSIANDMTTDQKEKAQEVIVPTILVRIVSLAMRRFD